MVLVLLVVIVAVAVELVVIENQKLQQHQDVTQHLL